MIEPFIDNQKLIIDFVANGIWQGNGSFEPFAQGIGFGSLEKGIVAGVIYHNYDDIHSNIELSCYSICNNWFTKKNLNIIMDYPFNQISIRLIKATFEENNQKSKRLFRALNAKLSTIPDLFVSGENVIIATLEREMWLKSKLCDRNIFNGKKRP